MTYTGSATDVNAYFPSMANGAGSLFGLWFIIGFIVLMVVMVVLKGFALWRAARNGHTGWFVVMLVINLVGILEIIYLLTAGKEDKMSPKVPAAPVANPVV